MDRLPLATRSLVGLLVLFACAAGSAIAAACVSAVAPPDLRIEWSNGAHWSRSPPALRGHAGDTLSPRIRVRNVGGEDVYAVILSSGTALGPLGRPARVYPGPSAGGEVGRTLVVPLADGMRELCVTATLQTLRLDDPVDPNPTDNRACRRIQIVSEGEQP